MRRFLIMRKRPHHEKSFIRAAIVDQSEQEAEAVYNAHVKWPLLPNVSTPLMADGTVLRKPMTLPLKEYEWNTIDDHTKRLGISKAEWIRYAIFRVMQEELEALKMVPSSRVGII